MRSFDLTYCTPPVPATLLRSCTLPSAGAFYFLLSDQLPNSISAEGNGVGILIAAASTGTQDINLAGTPGCYQLVPC